MEVIQDRIFLAVFSLTLLKKLPFLIFLFAMLSISLEFAV